MAKRPNQRLKLLYLAKIMLRLTDDEHGLQVEQIINELAKYDIAAERKSIYSDLEALQLFGIDIEKKHIGRYVYYCVGNRNLELAELKLLVDAVQSSKFITEKKSSQLIEKLERYVSQYEAKQLNQTIKIVREITNIMGGAPKRIFVEVAREPGEKGVRKVSRRNQLLDLYKACKKEAPELYDRLANKESDNALRSDKLFLYYSQMGRCMYSGDAIDLDELFTNRYDIDHIYPQSKVMDDSIDNRVLVKRDLNSKKTDTFPVPEEYRKAGKPLWSTLLKKGLISKEKYKRLTRTEPFGEDELAGFIARQLVETRQSTKAVAHLLEEAYPDAEIVYAKARAVSKFRNKFDMIKVREVNDFHHAKDAYLNIVVGNTYYVKFTKDAAWFVRNNPGRTYNLKKMFENETVKRGNETAWIPGDNGTICTVKKWMRKNNVLFTRRAYEVKGGLFDQNILKKGKGQIPIKGGVDERLQSIEKYGAYNKASGAYFMLVESDGKKGERKRTIEFVPVFLAKSLEESVELRRRYCEEELGLVNPDVRIPKIKINTLFDVDGFKMHLSGRSSNGLIFKGANQLVVPYKIEKIIKVISKYCLDYKENKEAVLSEKIRPTEGMFEELFDLLVGKLEYTVYEKRLSAQVPKLKNGKIIFDALSAEEKCIVLMEILHLFQCASQSANLKLLNGPGRAGILTMGFDISTLSNVYIINQSITGFYEQVIDLKTI